MKRVLILGAQSYIGDSFNTYLSQWPEDYTIDVIDVRTDNWKGLDWSKYDTAFQVAGIAHIKETAENRHLYYEVNRDLTADLAQQAKASGIKQYIYLSSMSVYGMDTGIITKDTVPMPKTNYGKSKLQAEELLTELVDTSFKVCILRPPMVYGDGCKGNYQTLKSLALKLPVFPKVNNQRSMVSIDKLCQFIKEYIDNESSGLFFPQNEYYVNTTRMAVEIAAAEGKTLQVSAMFGFGVLIFLPFIPKIKKAFGSLIYK